MPTTTVHPVELPIDAPNRMSGGPMFSSTLIEPESGATHVNANWSEALWEWSITVRREDAVFRALHGFFMARMGPAFGWLFEDPMDYKDNDNGGVGLVREFDDGFRYLCKKYPDVDDYNPYYRIIRMAREDTLEFAGTGGTPVYNPVTGKVTGAATDGTATFEFVNPVIFMTDICRIQRDPEIGEWADVVVRELRTFALPEEE